jgi:hypothetical protein
MTQTLPNGNDSASQGSGNTVVDGMIYPIDTGVDIMGI